MPLRSMTGYGHYQGEDDSLVQMWEIRSVNNRHLDPKWRMPSAARGLEPRLDKLLRKHAGRGRVEVSLSLQNSGALSHMAFDADQAAVMLDSLRRFAQSRGDSFEPDYAGLMTLPPLWTTVSAREDELWHKLEKGFTAALADWNAAREAEAVSLAADLTQRFTLMSGWVRQIEERAPAIKEERFRQVRDRLAEMLASLENNLEEGRFLQEMVIMADRLDVSEELTRLQAHLGRMGELLNMGDDAGRKLDFTLQECFREINTCGNKIQDVSVSRVIVDFKNELEKCREQVQNLE